MTHISEIINFFEITIGCCKFLQVAIICKYIRVHDFDWSTNPNLLKIDIHVGLPNAMMHVWNNVLCFNITIGRCKFMQLAGFFANTLVCTIMTDLLTRSCWKLIYMYVSWWCMSKIFGFFLNTIGIVAHLCKLLFFANKLMCTVLTDLLSRVC